MKNKDKEYKCNPKSVYSLHHKKDRQTSTFC